MGNNARGNAVVTCFITWHTFGCQTKPLKTKNERERGGEGCSGRREIFTPTGGCKIYYVKNKINVNDFLNFSPYRAVNTHCLGYKKQSVNAV
jgi:hypothetical protein